MPKIMPPRSSLTSSFSVSDQTNEVVCPLRNQDGTNCRKRCLGEKRYRSVQEHIRRAHPEHYIPKLPATEESFNLMVNTPPSARSQPPTTESFGNNVYGHDRDAGHPNQRDHSSAAVPRSFEEMSHPASTAAVALAQLHYQTKSFEVGSEAGNISETDGRRPGTSSSLELPPINNHIQRSFGQHVQSPRTQQLLPSMMPKSPPGRSSTLPPLARPRPRKSSVTQNARKPKHERTKSKEQARRLSIGERKAYSAEPQGPSSDGDRRWQGLIEAATSATEADSDRELTPIAQSPHVKRERTQPPFYPHLHSKPLEASPLQKNLTYTSDLPDPDPEREFPSVESSLDSGHNFHMHSSGLSNTNSDSSPIFRHPVEIYCASCRRPTILKESYACPDCICGICVDCVYLINGQNDRRSSCPRCQQSGKEYKQFSLEFVL